MSRLCRLKVFKVSYYLLASSYLYLRHYNTGVVGGENSSLRRFLLGVPLLCGAKNRWVVCRRREKGLPDHQRGRFPCNRSCYDSLSLILMSFFLLYHGQLWVRYHPLGCINLAEQVIFIHCLELSDVLVLSLKRKINYFQTYHEALTVVASLADECRCVSMAASRGRMAATCWLSLRWATR